MGVANFDFSDEIVIVTGGSSGIGREIALKFGQAGATVINADVNCSPKDTDAQQPTHEEIRSEGGNAKYVKVDVSKRGDIESVIKATQSMGGVDVFVNNAAIHQASPFFEISQEEFDRVYRVNIRGTFFGMQIAAHNMMKDEKSGSIINIGSISSTEVQEENLIYEASKAAVKMLTRSASFALANHDIRVNTVAPGHTATEFLEGLTERQWEKAKNDEYIKPLPLGRPAEPRDIASAVLFLSSDDASYITGEILHVDGGWQTL